MSAETINNHVLIPNSANWAMRPQWSRAWQTAAVGAVTGKESRYSLRANARVTMRFQVTTETIASTQQLHDRLRAAVKSGLGCAPYHGRGGGLVASVEAGADEVQVRDAWLWQSGDYFFCGNEDAFDAKLVSAAVLDAGVWTLTLDEVLDHDHAQGSFAWPLLFGKLTAPDLATLTPRAGDVQITIAEQTSARATQLGAVVPDAGVGIGHMAVGSTFTVG